jgi:hypothetical protein
MALVKPAATDQYEFAQSKYQQLPEIPVRAIVAAPSGAGKTVLLQSMVLDLYRTKSGKSPFSRIYIWSPSVNVDPAWVPVKKFTREELGVNEDKEKLCYDSYVTDELADVIKTQKRIVDAQKKRGDKKLYSILIIVDDFADSPAFSRHSVLLHELYTRGRHAAISSITSVQRYRVLSPIIRVNATALIVFRLRNTKEYEAICEENSAVVSRDEFRRLYQYATSEPYSFLFINAMAKTADEMFWLRFE